MSQRYQLVLLGCTPGKQMAIDADLNAGILTPDEAKARREEVTRKQIFMVPWMVRQNL